MRLSDLAPALQKGEKGIYYSRNTEPISYPEEANAACFAVEDESFWFQHRNKCLAAVCTRFIPERFLADVGGGNGAVAHHLVKEGFRAILIEPGPEGCRNAAGRGLEEVVCATLEGADFLPASLPAIGAFDVLEHIEKEGDFLAACHRALQPGGKLVLTVPALNALWSHEDDYAGHFRRYTTGSVRRVLQANGFDPLYCTYFFTALVPAILMGRVLPYRLGKRPNQEQPTNMARDHASPAAKAMKRLLDWEVNAIARRKYIPLGSSCLVVAEAARSNSAS